MKTVDLTGKDAAGKCGDNIRYEEGKRRSREKKKKSNQLSAAEEEEILYSSEGSEDYAARVLFSSVVKRQSSNTSKNGKGDSSSSSQFDHLDKTKSGHAARAKNTITRVFGRPVDLQLPAQLSGKALQDAILKKTYNSSRGDLRVENRACIRETGHLWIGNYFAQFSDLDRLEDHFLQQVGVSSSFL